MTGKAQAMYRTELIGDEESKRLARMLLEHFGERALQHARSNAEKLLYSDDIQGGAAWMRVARAVDGLLAHK